MCVIVCRWYTCSFGSEKIGLSHKYLFSSLKLSITHWFPVWLKGHCVQSSQTAENWLWTLQSSGKTFTSIFSFSAFNLIYICSQSFQLQLSTRKRRENTGPSLHHWPRTAFKKKKKSKTLSYQLWSSSEFILGLKHIPLILRSFSLDSYVLNYSSLRIIFVL